MNRTLEFLEVVMKTKRILEMMAIAMAVTVFTLTGCSGDGKAEKPNQAAPAAEAGAMPSTIAGAELLGASRPAVTGEKGFPIADMIRVDSTLYAVAGNELIITDLKTKSERRVSAAEGLYAVTEHNGKIYAGGTALYELGETGLEPAAAAFDGTIRALTGHEYRLMIGTSTGLFASSIFGDEALFEGIDVTAMAGDSDELWVGTGGQGLYRWDGAEFQRRYLLRDTAVFDFINALAFAHGHLFVGTDEALYVYDGGRWETVTTDDGLPSNRIRSIDASGWVVYLGTPAGVASWFNYDVAPVARLEDRAATLVRTFGRKLIVATEREGVLLKAGPVVSTLIRAETIPVLAEAAPQFSEPLPAGALVDSADAVGAQPVAAAK